MKRNRRNRRKWGVSLGRDPNWGPHGYTIIGALFALLLVWGNSARAQYVPIPNFTGSLAGQQFRNALNNKLNGSDSIAPQLVHIYTYQLPASVVNGQMYYLNDGAAGTPCQNGGPGSIAIGINGKWVCGDGHLTPDNFSGTDYWAKIQAAENWCVAAQTLNGCQIDASANLLAKTASGTTRLVISKPTKILVQGNLDYTGAGNAAGSIEFAAGSDGSELSCAPSGLDENDTNYNFGEGGSNNFTKQVACSITAEESSSTGNPIIVVDSGVSNVFFHDFNLQGDSSVSDGIQNNGRDGIIVQRVSFSHERPSGTPSNPTGWAYNGTNSITQNHTALLDNRIVAWSHGFKVNNSGTGGNVSVTILGNIFVITANQQLYIRSATTPRIQDNQFLSMFPTTTGVKKIEFDGTNQNILFQGNHIECDNQTAETGILELAVDSGSTMRSSSFINNSMHGNVGCVSPDNSTYDSDHLIDWASNSGWNNVISGNDFAGALNGVINFSVIGNNTEVVHNNVKAPGNGETACSAAPGPGVGCLLMAASNLPTLGQGLAPLHLSGLLGGLTSTAATTLLGDCTTTQNSGVLTTLTLTNDLNGGSCTTAPTYNIRDNTQGTTGTGKAASTTAGQVTQTETLTYSAGDQLCLVRTANGATCTAPFFSVSAQARRID